MASSSRKYLWLIEHNLFWNDALGRMEVALQHEVRRNQIPTNQPD